MVAGTRLVATRPASKPSLRAPLRQTQHTPVLAAPWVLLTAAPLAVEAVILEALWHFSSRQAEMLTPEASSALLVHKAPTTPKAPKAGAANS
jgi:hypothetical protein